MVIAAVGARTLVPYAITGHVADLDERNHNSGGSDVWMLQLADGRDYFIDAMTAETIENGADLHKAAWSRAITVNGHDRRVGASRASVGPPLWAMAVALLATGVVLFRPRSRRAEASPPSEPATSP
jgi:hypothetical protein